MKTAVVITIDTEPSLAGAFDDPARCAPLIHEPVWGEAGGRSQALGFLIEVFRRLAFEATFFVETAHIRYFGKEAMGAYVRRIAAAGQDIQLHLHPMWLNFENGAMKPERNVSDDCSDLDVAQLAELLVEGCDVIEEWTGKRPSSLRTGNFSTETSVYLAMQRVGLRTASNLCIAARVPADEGLRVSGGIHRFADILEYPVTCFADSGPVGRGAYRPCQVTSLSAAEQIAALEGVRAAGGSVAVILTHPFEFVKWDSDRYERLRPNRMVQRRLERLCGYLDANRDRFEVVPMSRITERCSHEELAVDLAGKPLRSVFRAAANFLNDRVG